MSTSSFSGPVRAGRVKADNQFHFGNTILAQDTTISSVEAGAQTYSFYVPKDSQILDIYFDVSTAFDSDTSAEAEVGTSSDSDAYASAVDLTSAGRVAAGFSAAELGSIADVGDEEEVVLTVTATGATTEGTVHVTLMYIQK